MGIWGYKLEVDIVFSEGFFVVLEHSLPRMQGVGAAPFWWRCPWHIIQALVISRACRFFRRWGWMELVS